MPGPIDTLRFVHAAILKESADIEAAVGAAASPTDVGPLTDRIDYFGELVNGHTSGEEVGLFPPLVERDEAIAETYLFDHVEERELFAELSTLARSCAAGDDDALARLRRQTVALSTHARGHIAKENDLIIPRVHALFSVEEQAEMIGGILSTFTPEESAVAIPWIIARLDPDPATAYVGALHKAMPPPVFDACRGWIQTGISDDQWTLLVGRAPVLAG